MHITTGPLGDVGTIDITPPGCTGFELAIPSIPGCRVIIPSQTGVASISYITNVGPPATITSTVNLSGVKYTTLTGCPLGPGGSHSNGTVKFSQRLKAFAGSVQQFFRIKR